MDKMTWTEKQIDKVLDELMDKETLERHGECAYERLATSLGFPGDAHVIDDGGNPVIKNETELLEAIETARAWKLEGKPLWQWLEG